MLGLIFVEYSGILIPNYSGICLLNFESSSDDMNLGQMADKATRFQPLLENQKKSPKINNKMNPCVHSKTLKHKLNKFNILSSKRLHLNKQGWLNW